MTAKQLEKYLVDVTSKRARSTLSVSDVHFPGSFFPCYQPSSFTNLGARRAVAGIVGIMATRWPVKTPGSNERRRTRLSLKECNCKLRSREDGESDKDGPTKEKTVHAVR